MHTNITTEENTTIIIVIAAITVGLAGLGTLFVAVMAQTETSTSISGGFADVQTVQDDSHIIITITKTGGEAPTGPIIVPEPDAGDDGTIIMPNENATDANATDVIVIEPNGTVTTVPDGNVTNVDNSTVVVAPTNQTVSETPGGVIVVDPPLCGCPSDPVAPEDATTTVPGAEDNATATVPVEPAPEPSGEEESNGDGNGNGNGSSEDNGTNPTSATWGLQ